MHHFTTFFILIFVVNLSLAQDPQRFLSEVAEVRAQNAGTSSSNPVVFTGSSSIRMWSDIQQRFPEYNVINAGFGGSQTSDMFYFAEELIIGYQPKQIFIYEGDNDLSEKKTPEQILSDTDKLLKYIRGRLPGKVQVAFITPKPSISRWHLRKEYETYIHLLKNWVGKQKNVVCIDVWSPMIDANGELKKDLFLEDDLHMNSKGYDLWTAAIRPYLKAKYKR